jgi:hypothetical protein
MVEFTLLSFGMCAALLHHPGLGPVQQFDDFIGIGQVKAKANDVRCFSSAIQPEARASAYKVMQLAYPSRKMAWSSK